MGKIWFTSDTHYSHRNSMRYCGRPFLTVGKCDEEMIKRWNKVVAPEDTVYHLGDVSMHTAPIKRILPQLNGKKILIIGNHDTIHPYFIKTRGQSFVDKMRKDYESAGFAEIYDSGHIIELLDPYSYVPWKVRLSHFPTKNAYDAYHSDKHDAFKPEDDGMLNICGHVHQAWLRNGNNINVGVDVWDFTPVSANDVLTMFMLEGQNMGPPTPYRIFWWKIYHTMVYNARRAYEWLRGKLYAKIKKVNGPRKTRQGKTKN